MYDNVADVNSDFDLLRAATPCDNQDNEHSGVSLSSSHGARLSLGNGFMGGGSCGSLNDACNNNNSPSPSCSLRHSLPRHSLGVHASATCSAGMLPPISGGLHSNPFDTGVIHSAPGYTMQGGLPAISEIDDGSMGMLTCSGTPGLRSQPGGADVLQQNASRTRAAAMSMPQVPQVSPLSSLSALMSSECQRCVHHYRSSCCGAVLLHGARRLLASLVC